MIRVASFLAAGALMCTSAERPPADPAPASASAPVKQGTSSAETQAAAGETIVRLAIPDEVANHAAARARGDAKAAPPILVLEELVVGAGEGFTLEVYGPDDELLAVSGLVGARQAELTAPQERMTLVVPLNDEGSRLLAGREEIALTLRLRDSPGRPSLEFARARFQTYQLD